MQPVAYRQSGLGYGATDGTDDSNSLRDTTVAVVSDEIAAHASRLDRITRHFGKSVHAEPSDTDAWMAYVQTWNIVIQLAHLARD